MPETILYDASGTLIPLPGPDTPPVFKVLPAGVAQEYTDRYRGYPSRNLTPARITSILEAADNGDPYEWIELCEEIVEKDPKIGSVLHTRTAAVLGLYYEVQPAKLDENATNEERKLADDIAKFVEINLAASNYDDMVGDILDAIGKPIAVDWIHWGLNGDGKVVPVKFQKIPTKHIRWANGSDQVYVYSPARAGYTNGELGQPLAPYTTVRGLMNSRRDHPTRSGLLRTLVWYYLFKNISIKDFVSWCDRFGMPVRILKASDKDIKNPELYQIFKTALLQMGTDGSAIISSNTELEIHDVGGGGTGGGSGPYQAVIDLVDKNTAWVVLGHELSSQSSSGSGQLGITAALQVRQDILEGDCKYVSCTIKRDVTNPMVGWNFGWDKLHLAPNITYNYEPQKDLTNTARYIGSVAATFPKFQFSEQQIRDTFALDRPLDDTADGQTDVLMPAQRSIGAGAGNPDAGVLPLNPPSGQPNPVNSLSVAKPPAKYRVGRQQKIDRIAGRGIKAGKVITLGWESEITQVLDKAIKDGVSLAEVRQQLVDLYPKLKVKELEKMLREHLVVATLFGRNG